MVIAEQATAEASGCSEPRPPVRTAADARPAAPAPARPGWNAEVADLQARPHRVVPLVCSGGTSRTRGTTARFVRLAAKVALPPKRRRNRQ